MTIYAPMIQHNFKNVKFNCIKSKCENVAKQFIALIVLKEPLKNQP